jgi:tRNA-modifying protein YgfZ
MTEPAAAMPGAAAAPGAAAMPGAAELTEPATAMPGAAAVPGAAPAYRSPLLERPGAVEADGVDAGVAAHYGEPYAEQRALAAGTALVDLSHRPVLRISGDDRLTWLHSLTSQHLDALAPGVATEALVLSPHGHVEHHLALVDDGEAVVAHVEPGTLAPLVAYLDSMRFWSKVEVADVSDALAVVADAAGWRAVPR